MAITCLVSVPASRPELIGKALATAADAVLIDLEDAVAPAQKGAARANIAVEAAGTPIIVRVNAPRTPWCHLDVVACAAPGGPDALMLPKVESAADIAFADRLLAGAESASGRTEPLGIVALIESAAGLAHAREIAEASPRLRALVLGYADLAANLGRSAAFPLERWLYAQETVLTAARAAGLAAIDGPHLGVAVDDEFHASVERAAELGFDGKWVIHPRQIDAVRAAFTPAPEELAHARMVLDAMADARASGLGAVTLDGRMIDEALAASARRVIARADGRS